MTPNPYELLSQREAARQYGVDEDELKAAREDGRIPWRRRGKACQMRRCDIEAYIASTVKARVTVPVLASTEEEPSDDDWVKRTIRELIPLYKPQRKAA